MKFIKYIYSGLLSIFNYPYIPKELLENLKGPILLHISDTLLIFINIYLESLKIEASKFVHTGDLVDNIKLEKYKDKIIQYQKRCKAD